MSAVAELTENLRELRRVIGELLTLSYEKRRVISHGDTDRLAEISSLETRLLSQLNAAERKRYAVAPAAMREISDGDGSTLGDLINASDGDARKTLSELKTELTSTMKLLMEMNERNTELLRKQIDHNADVIDVLTPPQDPLNNFYGGNGQLTDERQRGFYSGEA
ncbi:MAG: flagellar protein FlgN [Oscillospiraceae bacterium]|nr:flagellar protein FlgN [Oscillospiraceae bacterium]